LQLNIKFTTDNSAVSVANFTRRHTLGATVDASLKVKCYKPQHSVPALNRLSIELLVLLVRV